MMRSISACVLALSITAIGCAAPGGGDEDTSDESASTSDAIKYCPPDQVPCDPVLPPPPPPRPDLRAEIVNQGTYCSGTVQFRIRNVGTATAPASVASAAARDNTTLYFNVPSLPAGGSSVIFSRTFRPTPGDIGLAITADATRVVTESSETNNVAYGYCIT